VNTTQPLPLIDRAARWGERVALDGRGGPVTYGGLLEASEAGARHLLGSLDDLREAPVVFLVAP